MIDFHDRRIPEPGWLNGPPDYEPPPPRRCGCGAFLPKWPDRAEMWEEALDCDGSETFHDEPYPDSVADIIGDEFRGQTYRISVSPCGTEMGRHEPHREVQYAGATLIWGACRRCGRETRQEEG